MCANCTINFTRCRSHMFFRDIKCKRTEKVNLPTATFSQKAESDKKLSLLMNQKKSFDTDMTSAIDAITKFHVAQNVYFIGRYSRVLVR